MLLLIYDITVSDLDLRSGDEWWLSFLCLFRWLDNDRDLLLPLECVDVDDCMFVVVDDFYHYDEEEYFEMLNKGWNG